MQVSLIVIGGKHAGKIVLVTAPKFSIGRAPNCHIRSTSPLISRHHCVIHVGPCVMTVEDLGSKNGTFVNGEQVKGHRFLKSGDRLAVGSLEFEIQAAAAEGDNSEPEEVPGKRNPHEVSEQEKEARRRQDQIPGVSKAAQAKRITATTQDAALQALRKFAGSA